MSNRLRMRNRHRAQSVNSRWLRHVVQDLLQRLEVSSFDLSIYVVTASEMTHLNETYLHHEGATDVLAFDYTEAATPRLRGEIYVCPDVAKEQAKRFRTTWPSELVRYLVHGVLHLAGYDDHHPARRRKMKRQEDRLLKQLASRFDFGQLRVG